MNRYPFSRTMLRAKILSILNMLAAAALLIVVAVSSNDGRIQVTPAVIIEASKDKSPEFGQELMGHGIEELQRRITLLKWLCYGTLPLLTANAYYWARSRKNPPGD